MNQSLTNYLNLQLVFHCLQQRHIENDAFVLPDNALKASHALTAAEKLALLSSPLTLSRWQQLNRPVAIEISRFILRAADSGQRAFSIDSEDGKYTLHVTEGRKNYQIIAKLSPAWLKQVCPMKNGKHKCQHLMLRLLTGDKGDRKIHELESQQPNPETGEVIWQWPLQDTKPADFTGEFQLVFTNKQNELRVNMRKINAFFPQVQKHIAQMVVQRMGSQDDETSLAYALLNQPADVSQAVWLLIADIRDMSSKEYTDFQMHLRNAVAKKKAKGEQDLAIKEEFAVYLASAMLTYFSHEAERERLTKDLEKLRNTIKNKKAETEVAAYLYRHIENNYCSDLRWRVMASELSAEQGIVLSPNRLKVLSRVNKRRGELEYMLSNPSQPDHADLLAELLDRDVNELLKLPANSIALGFYHEDRNHDFPALLLAYDALETNRANSQLKQGEQKRQSFNCSKYNDIKNPAKMQEYLDCLIHSEFDNSLTTDEGNQQDFDANLLAKLYGSSNDEDTPLSQVIAKMEALDVPDSTKYAALKLLDQEAKTWPEIEAEYGMTKHKLVTAGKALIEYLQGDFLDDVKHLM